MYRIKVIRKKRGLKQVQLADRLGITNIYLCKIEAGRADPSQKLLRRIAGELGVTPGELYDNDIQLHTAEGA